jgi:hypothetical protein
MFKSLQKRQNTVSHRMVDVVIDDDFEEELTRQPSYTVIIDAGFLIKLYQSKNLNVSANLILYFKYISSQYTTISIQDQIDWNSKYNSLYKPYAEEIEKYFILL